MFEINGYKFNGGGICPEQYDVYKNNKKVAYVRLRFGCCEVTTKPLGDYIWSYDRFGHWQGEFNSEKQRMYYLKLITKRIEKFYQVGKKCTRKPPKQFLKDVIPKNREFYYNLFEDIIQVTGEKLAEDYKQK